MYIFLIYVCLQKHCLWLICLSSMCIPIRSYLWRECKRFIIPSQLIRFDPFWFITKSDVARQACLISLTWVPWCDSCGLWLNISTLPLKPSVEDIYNRHLRRAVLTWVPRCDSCGSWLNISTGWRKLKRGNKAAKLHQFDDHGQNTKQITLKTGRTVPSLRNQKQVSKTRPTIELREGWIS